MEEPERASAGSAEAAATAAQADEEETTGAASAESGVDPRSQAVRRLLASLPTVEPPIFPGPIPARRAPRFGDAVWPQLEPLRPVPESGGRRARTAPAPAPARKPRSQLLYGPPRKLRPPSRRRRGRGDEPAPG